MSQIYAENKKSKTIYEKKIILKGNVRITHTENKYRNTETSVLIHPRNVEKRYP